MCCFGTSFTKERYATCTLSESFFAQSRDFDVLRVHVHSCVKVGWQQRARVSRGNALCVSLCIPVLPEPFSHSCASGAFAQLWATEVSARHARQSALRLVVFSGAPFAVSRALEVRRVWSAVSSPGLWRTCRLAWASSPRQCIRIVGCCGGAPIRRPSLWRGARVGPTFNSRP